MPETCVYTVRIGKRRAELIESGEASFSVNIQKNVATRREKWVNKVPTFTADKQAAFRIARLWCEKACMKDVPLPSSTAS